jgi:hypothetical protein
VLGRGLINLKIEPEVSQIDTTHTVSVSNGVAVPALIVRRASTTVELRDGQSFVIGGLLQSDNKNAIEQLPWLGSIRFWARCSPASPIRRTKPTSPSLSRRASCVRRGRGRNQGADGRHIAAERRRLLLDGQERDHA